MNETLTLVAYGTHSERPLSSDTIDNTVDRRYLLGLSVTIGALNSEYIRVHLQAADTEGNFYDVLTAEVYETAVIGLPQFLPPQWRVQIGTSDLGSDEYGVSATIY